MLMGISPVAVARMPCFGLRLTILDKPARRRDPISNWPHITYRFVTRYLRVGHCRGGGRCHILAALQVDWTFLGSSRHVLHESVRLWSYILRSPWLLVPFSQSECKRVRRAYGFYVSVEAKRTAPLPNPMRRHQAPTLCSKNSWACHLRPRKLKRKPTPVVAKTEPWSTESPFIGCEIADVTPQATTLQVALNIRQAHNLISL